MRNRTPLWKCKLQMDRPGMASLKHVRSTLAVLCCSAILTGCGASTISQGSARPANDESLDLQQFLILAQPPTIAAANLNEVAAARQKLAQVKPASLQERLDSRIESANALPWLTGSQLGREFLSTKGSRVLVRGAPRQFCPTALIEQGDAPVPDLAATALRKCLAQSSDKCGCEVIAAGSVLLVPRTEVNYATAIGARIRASTLNVDGFVVAEEGKRGNILLRSLDGEIGRVERAEDGTVRVILANISEPFQGRSIPVGYRRGRLAERIYATDSDGNRLTLLIGFDPEELASLAGAWLAWPKGS